MDHDRWSSSDKKIIRTKWSGHVFFRWVEKKFRLFPSLHRCSPFSVPEKNISVILLSQHFLRTLSNSIEPLTFTFLRTLEPIVQQIYEEHIFRKKDPITLGVKVLEGTARVGTPLVVHPGAGDQLEVAIVISFLRTNHDHSTMLNGGCATGWAHSEYWGKP